MPGITFMEGSGLQDSIFGKSQEPIQKFLEKRAEAFEQQSCVKELFSMGTSKNYAEKLTAMTGMEGFQPVGENGAYPEDQMQESFSKTLEHETWKDSFAISREMVDDCKVMDLKKKPEAFIAGYHRTRERFGAALLAGAAMGADSVNFGGKKFDTSAADKKCLFHKAHPSKLGKKAQANCFSDAFSNAALAAAEARMQDFRGDVGEVLNIMPTRIVIPNLYKLKMDVFAAIGADKDPDTNHNGFNYNFGRWTVTINPYLNEFIEDGNAPWIVMADDYNETAGGAVWFDRVALEVTSKLADNDANVWKGYARFSAGFNDWRFACCGGMAGGDALI